MSETERHLLVARQVGATAPHSYGRGDHIAGAWRVTPGMSDNFRAQIDALILGQLGSVSITISPRLLDHFLAAPPSKITVATGLAATILMPIGQAGAPHLSRHWVRVISIPASGHFAPVEGSEFVEQTLAAELRKLLSEAECSSFISASHRSEIWIRPGWSAAALFPARWPAYVHKNGDPPARPDNLTPAELADRKRKNRLAKEASTKWQVAENSNRADAAEYAQSVVAAVRAERGPKKKPR